MSDPSGLTPNELLRHHRADDADDRHQRAATGAATRVQLPDLAPGEYAVALYQDVNDNGKMDTLLFGTPSERTGASNNAPGNFGPPQYEAARFTMAADDKALAIELHK